MRRGQHSSTAEFMAFFRALETARGRHLRLFSDRWAKRFLKPSHRLLVALSRLDAVGDVLQRYIDWRWPGARSSAVARTRYIDDAIVEALDTGIDQFVMLGAGFDCRAQRLTELQNVRVFEVDHPDTSRVKQLLLGSEIAGSANVTYVQADFAKDDVYNRLYLAGFDPSRRGLFLWEGVTQYLERSSVDATLRYIGRSLAGSRLLFTYIDRKVLQTHSGFIGIDAIRRALEKSREPWVFGLDPAEVQVYLQRHGLRLISDLDAPTYRSLVMNGAPRYSGYEFYRVVVAEVLN
jgi:methyltransferase (TIGR00027 family)